jgi:hypothetical protein
MAIHNTPEERQIVKLLEKLALPEAELQGWIDQIHSNGMSEELAEQIHTRLNTPLEGDLQLPNRAILAVEFAQRIRRWRLTQGARKFR